MAEDAGNEVAQDALSSTLILQSCSHCTQVAQVHTQGVGLVFYVGRRLQYGSAGTTQARKEERGGMRGGPQLHSTTRNNSFTVCRQCWHPARDMLQVDVWSRSRQ